MHESVKRHPETLIQHGAISHTRGVLHKTQQEPGSIQAGRVRTKPARFRIPDVAKTARQEYRQDRLHCCFWSKRMTCQGNHLKTLAFFGMKVNTICRQCRRHTGRLDDASYIYLSWQSKVHESEQGGARTLRQAVSPSTCCQAMAAQAAAPPARLPEEQPPAVEASPQGQR